MKLSVGQQKALQVRLDKLDIHCAACGKRNFTLVDKVYELREFNEGNLVIGSDSSVIPLVLLVCIDCGAIVTISAIKLGIFDLEEKKVNSDGQSPPK